MPSIKAGKFLVDEWTAAEKNAATLDFDGTLKALAAESAFYADAINGFSDEELRAEVNLFGKPANRGRLLIDLIVSGHAAYRTQLFCYLKACGREELGTANLWRGVDPAPAQ